MSIIVLDFDGVLFDSAYEAYSVCQKVTELNHYKEIRKDISYTEFRLYRPYVKNANDFITLYFDESIQNNINVDDFLAIFFDSRKKLMTESDYSSKYFPRCQFFDLIQPYIQRYISQFYILSTRDADSIDIALTSNGINMTKNIIGQQDIKKYGNKINALKAHNINVCDLYIDDMLHYVKELNSVASLSLMANWGYDLKNEQSISANVMSEILKYILLRK